MKFSPYHIQPQHLYGSCRGYTSTEQTTATKSRAPGDFSLKYLLNVFIFEATVQQHFYVCVCVCVCVFTAPSQVSFQCFLLTTLAIELINTLLNFYI